MDNVDTKIYWKVLKPSRKSINNNKKLSLTYDKQRWTHPKIIDSFLMVFDSEENAKFFIAGYEQGYIIVPCLISNKSTEDILVICQVNDMSPSDVKLFWKYKITEGNYLQINLHRQNCGDMEYHKAPLGTVFCKGIWCLK
jgi:hypothetical protein